MPHQWTTVKKNMAFCMNHSGGQRILSTAQQQPVLAGLHLALGSGGQEGDEAAGSADAQAIVHGR